MAGRPYAITEMIKNLLLVICAALLLVGCASKESKIIGKWKGSVEIPESQKKDPMAAMAASMMSNVSLELKEDKTYAMSMVFPLEGTWALEGDTLKLTTTKAMGMSMDDIKSKVAASGTKEQQAQLEKNGGKPMILKLSDDGKTLVAQAESGKTGGITFTKEEK